MAIDSDSDLEDKKRLEEERKHDEEIFLERKRLQEKERKELHVRTVKGKISDLERTLAKKELELRAINSEIPNLEGRIGTAVSAERKTDAADIARAEARVIDDIKYTLTELEETEKSLEHKLVEIRRKEEVEEEKLRDHTRKHDEGIRSNEATKRTAEDEERTAKLRMQDKKRDGSALEVEIRRLESDIGSLKREIQ